MRGEVWWNGCGCYMHTGPWGSLAPGMHLSAAVLMQCMQLRCNTTLQQAICWTVMWSPPRASWAPEDLGAPRC